MSSRPSVTSRLSFALSTASNAERGEPIDEPGVAADQQIEEEIAEIKRYEVCAPASSVLLKLRADVASRTLRL